MLESQGASFEHADFVTLLDAANADARVNLDAHVAVFAPASAPGVPEDPVLAARVRAVADKIDYVAGVSTAGGAVEDTSRVSVPGG